MENFTINPYLEFFQNNKESLDNEVLKLTKLSYIRFLGENNNCFFFSYKLNGVKVIKFVFNDNDELVDIFINNKNIILTLNENLYVAYKIFLGFSDKKDKYREKIVEMNEDIIDDMANTFSRIWNKNYYLDDETRYFEQYLPVTLHICLATLKTKPRSFGRYLARFQAKIYSLAGSGYYFDRFIRRLLDELAIPGSAHLDLLKSASSNYFISYGIFKYYEQSSDPFLRTVLIKYGLDYEYNQFYSSYTYLDLSIPNDYGNGFLEESDFLKLINKDIYKLGIIDWIIARVETFADRTIYQKLKEILDFRYYVDPFLLTLDRLAEKFNDIEMVNFIKIARLYKNAKFDLAFQFEKNIKFTDYSILNLLKNLKSNFADNPFIDFYKNYDSTKKFSLTYFYRIPALVIYINNDYFLRIDRLSYLNGLFKYLEKEKSKKNYDTFTISCLLVIIYTTSNLEFEKIIKDPFFNDFINRDLFRMMQLRSSIQYNIQLPNTYLFKE